MTIIRNIIRDLNQLSNKEKAKKYSRFFKTGKGEYGEGDQFLGLTVPQQRAIAKKYFQRTNLNETQNLLSSKIHEHRLTALLILILKYQKGNSQEKEKFFHFYLKNTKHINNWDLVDLSCREIIGNFLLEQKNKKILFQLAKSKNLWEKRIAMISTFPFIKKADFSLPLSIAELLINDKHDLIQKAIGWMLREIGKKDQKVEEDFLKRYGLKMGRVTLRYAIEKFSEKKRRRYLDKTKLR